MNQRHMEDALLLAAQKKMGHSPLGLCSPGQGDTLEVYSVAEEESSLRGESGRNRMGPSAESSWVGT